MHLILCLMFLLLGVQQASAHAMLMGTEPAQGAILEQDPDRVVLHFMQPVTPLKIDLIDASSRVIPIAGVNSAGNDLVVPLPHDLQRGTHLLSWRVLGQDPHPVSGMLTFSLQAVTETPSVPMRDEGRMEKVLWGLQLVFDFSLLISLGGTLFRFWLFDGKALPPLAMHGIRAGICTAAVTVVILSLLQAVQVLDASWALFMDARDALRILWLTGGLEKSALVFAAVLAAAAVPRRGSPAAKRLVSGLATGLGCAAIAIEGHGTPGVSTLAARAVLFSHAVSLMFWVGSLLPLCSLLLAGSAHEALARFSRVIPAFLALLVLSGLAMVSLHVRSLADLFVSGFGLVLLAKLFLFVLLLAIAAYNRYALTGRLLAGVARSGQRLASFAGVEIGLVVAIIAIAGLWRFEPPGMPQRSPITPIAAEIDQPELWASITISPGFEQARSLSLMLDGQGEGGAGKLQSVEVTAAPENGALPAVRRALRKQDDQMWEAQGLYLPIPGPWQFEFAVVKADGTRLQVSRTIFITQ